MPPFGTMGLPAIKDTFRIKLFLATCVFLSSPLAYYMQSGSAGQGPVFAAGNVPIAKWEVLSELNSPRKVPASVRRLTGKTVRIPGFLVPLDGDERGFKTFLLVPSQGQCFHVPPPPPNNIIYCKSKRKIEFTYEPVWIYGRLQVRATQSEIAPAYYRFRVTKTRPFEDYDVY